MTVQYNGKLYDVYLCAPLGEVLVDLSEHELLVPARNASWLLNMLRYDAHFVADAMDALEEHVDPAGAWVWNIEYDGQPRSSRSC